MRGAATLVTEAELEALAEVLARAAAAAGELGPTEPIGVRAVEPRVGIRRYLCAFAGPRFLCLDAELRPVTQARPVREAAAAVLLWERALDEVDVGALHAFASASGALLARGVPGAAVDAALQELTAAALRLAAWKDAPERALASVTDIEDAIARQAAVRDRYGDFVRATDPLAADQDSLEPDLVAALREIEECAGRARVADPLAGRLGEWMADCDEGAADVVVAHITPLDEGDDS